MNKPVTGGFSLPSPMIIDQCRLDTMVLGPNGEQTGACLAVIITPAVSPHPHFSYQLPPEIDAHFRGIADAVRDVLGPGRGRDVEIDGDFLDHELRAAQ